MAHDAPPQGSVDPRLPPLPPRRAGLAIVRELGRGGMGVVWEVAAPEGGRHALKTLVPGADAEARLRFRAEGELMARLDHPHVGRVHDAELEGPAPWLLVDLLPGGSLQDELARGGPLPLGRALALAAKVARALEHAHARGVLHRDVKPQNVLLDDRGEPRVVDFGLARGAAVGPDRLTVTGEVLGSPAYLAPEQALDAKAADARADVYGVGALLFALLTGAPPFAGPTVLATLQAVIAGGPPPPSARRAGVPPDVDRLVLAALARDPGARPPTAGALAEALEALAARHAVAAGGGARGAEGAGDPADAARRRLGLGLVAAGCVGLAVALTAGVLAARARQGDRAPAARADPRPAADPPTDLGPAPTPATGLPVLEVEGDLPLRVEDGVVRVGGVARGAGPGPARVVLEPLPRPGGRSRWAPSGAGPTPVVVEADAAGRFARELELVPLFDRLRVRLEDGAAPEVVVPLAHEPAWWHATAPEARPPWPLPRGLETKDGREFRHKPSGLELVWVPGGQFVMGDDGGEAAMRPAHPVTLSGGLFLGRTEVTWRAWRRWLQTSSRSFAFELGPDDNAAVGMTWHEAAAFCASFGLRLPTEAEWELACRGPDGRRFPWGDVADPRHAVVTEGVLALGRAASEGQPLGRVGTRPTGAAPCGALDLVGNVEEWVFDVFAPYDGAHRVDPRVDGPARVADGREAPRVVRGGSWNTELRERPATRRTGRAPDLADACLGFRVALSPPPE